MLQAGTHLLDAGPLIAVRCTRPGLARAAVPLFYRRVGNARGVPSTVGGMQRFLTACYKWLARQGLGMRAGS